MCEGYFLGHYHHRRSCSRSWSFAYQWDFCTHAPADLAGYPVGQPCANAKWQNPPLVAPGAEPCSSSKCLLSPDCGEGTCRLEDLGGRWRCCRCHRDGNVMRSCRHKQKGAPDSFCNHVVCSSCTASH